MRPLAYRLLLTLAGAAAVWVGVGDQWQSLLPWPLAGNPTVAQLSFAALSLAACAAAILTLNFETRQNVSLIALPVTLAWWQVGLGAAVAAALFGGLFGNALRRGPALGSVAGGARLALAAAVAGWLAALVPGADATAAEAGVLTLPALGQAAVFVLALSLVDGALDLLDRRLHRGHAGPAGPPDGAADHLTRTDVAFNLLLFPLVVLFQAIYLALGWERQGVMLAGLFAALLVVRTYTNVRTLYASLRRLHGVVAEEREKLDTLVTHSGEAIFTIDPELRVSTANPALEELLAVERGAILGQPCAEVCHFEDAHGTRLCPDQCPLVAAQREGKPVTVDVVYQAPEQAPKHVLLTYAAVTEPSGSLRLGIGIARDMTAQHEVERLREEFVSLVTHELRSPLTSSTGYLDLLKRMIERAPVSAGLDLAKAVSYVERIQGAERHLLRLVNNLLDIARIERAELPVELSEVELGRLVTEAVDAVAPQAGQKAITVSREGEAELPPVWTSELYVGEILGNLISNAVKYTPEGGAVTVRLSRDSETQGRGDAGSDSPSPRLPLSASPHEGWAVVEVADTGYGMSEEELGRLFGKFFRSGRPEIRKERGTGLGLALSKQMAQRLGGDITVRSELGVGSTFTLRLPLTPVPQEEMEDNGGAERPGEAVAARAD